MNKSLKTCTILKTNFATSSDIVWAILLEFEVMQPGSSRLLDPEPELLLPFTLPVFTRWLSIAFKYFSSCLMRTLGKENNVIYISFEILNTENSETANWKGGQLVHYRCLSIVSVFGGSWILMKLQVHISENRILICMKSNTEQSALPTYRFNFHCFKCQQGSAWILINQRWILINQRYEYQQIFLCTAVTT